MEWKSLFWNYKKQARFSSLIFDVNSSIVPAFIGDHGDGITQLREQHQEVLILIDSINEKPKHRSKVKKNKSIQVY